jgi:geranylgeranylglycerol-phosphate geranylgeranyltransferase
MMLSGFANLAREIVKDLEDLEGDRKSFLKRLVDKATVSIGERFGITSRGVRLKRGKHGLLVLATVSLIIAIIISPTPYLMGIFGISYLIVLIPTDLIFLYAAVSIMRAGKRRKFSRISKQIKIGMFLGLLAFIAGALL